VSALVSQRYFIQGKATETKSQTVGRLNFAAHGSASGGRFQVFLGSISWDGQGRQVGDGGGDWGALAATVVGIATARSGRDW